MEGNRDCLVRWDKDESTNVVSMADLKFRKGSTPRKGTIVKMKWPDGIWRGKIVMIEEEQDPMDEEQEHMDEDSDSGEDENVPLANYARKLHSIPKISCLSEEKKTMNALDGSTSLIQSGPPRVDPAVAKPSSGSSAGTNAALPSQFGFLNTTHHQPSTDALDGSSSLIQSGPPRVDPAVAKPSSGSSAGTNAALPSQFGFLNTTHHQPSTDALDGSTSLIQFGPPRVDPAVAIPSSGSSAGTNAALPSQFGFLNTTHHQPSTGPTMQQAPHSLPCDDIPPDPAHCESHMCDIEVFAACHRCLTLLCFDHFEHSEPCVDHKIVLPEHFEVDGFDIDTVDQPEQPLVKKSEITKSKNRIVKHMRNKGEGYQSEKSGKLVDGRRHLSLPRCNIKSLYCEMKDLKCSMISDRDMYNIRNSFYDMGSLKLQREWLARFLESKPCGKGGRKKQTISYSLPCCSPEGQKITVCRKMFLATLGVSDRQVNTVLEKRNDQTGVLQGEKRGGKQKLDPVQEQKIVEHLTRFPRVPSHYCRASSSHTYLASDLTQAQMHRMFVAEYGECASLSTYKRVFKMLKYKIHRPKKDMCGLCANNMSTQSAEKEPMSEAYQKHRAEIEHVRSIKNKSKERSKMNPHSFGAAIFDLQQVMYVPKSNRSEIFYKRRLACYNLTVYDLNTKDGICYFSNETVTKRGSCEIASYLLDYLREVDTKGVKEVDLFSDGCSGQNKNSVLPSMAIAFLRNSLNVNCITFHFFETNHGQSECDTIHSVIENKVSKTLEILHPSHLASLIKGARYVPGPYIVKCVQSSDILDWKSYSQALGMLRTRSSDEGESVDWTTFKQVRLHKDFPEKVFFKISHCQEDFLTITLGLGRRSIQAVGLPQKLYLCRPKLSVGKYQDLVSLCKGPNPVVSQPELVDFYTSLPHS